MNTLEKRIKLDILTYLSLYGRYGRARVLDQYFFVIGNGLDWRQGMLVHLKGYRDKSSGDYKELEGYGYVKALRKERYPDPVKKFSSFKERLSRALDEKDLKDNRKVEIVRSLWKEDLKEAKRVRDSIDELMKMSFQDGFCIYPLASPYSCIFEMPVDVRPEWLAGAVEAVKISIKSIDFIKNWKEPSPEEWKESLKNFKQWARLDSIKLHRGHLKSMESEMEKAIKMLKEKFRIQI